MGAVGALVRDHAPGCLTWKLLREAMDTSSS